MIKDMNWVDNFDFLWFASKNLRLLAIINDLFLREDYPLGNGSKVHSGWYTAWKRLSDKAHDLIDLTLALHCPSCNHIVCTGHSLGALSGSLVVYFPHHHKAPP